MSTETLRQALKDCLDWMESLRACGDAGNWEWGAASEYARGIAALEAKDEPVGLIESLKDAQPCCGQYATCWRACTPRGKFIGHRDAQRKPLTGEMLLRAAQASLSPEQYDHFEAISKHQPDIYDRLAYAIGVQDE